MPSPALILPGVFLSTPSARRATLLPARHHRAATISIHALREEGDCQGCADGQDGKKFLSTPSARRATSDKAYLEREIEFLSTPSARRATL